MIDKKNKKKGEVLMNKKEAKKVLRGLFPNDKYYPITDITEALDVLFPPVYF